MAGRHFDEDHDGTLDHLQAVQDGIEVTLADPLAPDPDDWTGVCREITPAERENRSDG